MSARLFRVGLSRVGGPHVVGGGIVPPTGINGSCAVTITTTGIVKRGVFIGGTCSITVSTSGAVTKPIVISGTAAVTVSTSGGLTLSGAAIAGTAAITISISGRVAAGGEIHGTSAITITTSGKVSGEAHIGGTSAIVVTTSGNVHGTTSHIAGTTHIQISPAGNVHAGTAHITGSSSIAITATGFVWGAAPTLTGTWSETEYHDGATVTFTGTLSTDTVDWIEVTADITDIDADDLTITVDIPGGPTAAPLNSGPWLISKVTGGSYTVTVTGTAHVGPIGLHQCITLSATEVHSAEIIDNTESAVEQGPFDLTTFTLPVSPPMPLHAIGDALVLEVDGFFLADTPVPCNDPTGWTLIDFTYQQGIGTYYEILQTWYRIADGTSDDTPTVSVPWDPSVFPIRGFGVSVITVRGAIGGPTSHTTDTFSGPGSFDSTMPSETPPGTVLQLAVLGGGSGPPTLDNPFGTPEIGPTDLRVITSVSYVAGDSDFRHVITEAISTPSGLTPPGPSTYYTVNGGQCHTILFPLAAPDDLFTTRSHFLTQCFDLISGGLRWIIQLGPRT